MQVELFCQYLFWRSPCTHQTLLHNHQQAAIQHIYQNSYRTGKTKYWRMNFYFFWYSTSSMSPPRTFRPLKIGPAFKKSSTLIDFQNKNQKNGVCSKQYCLFYCTFEWDNFTNIWRSQIFIFINLIFTNFEFVTS